MTARLHLAEDLAGTVVADDVDRADADAFAALVTPAERLAALERDDLAEHIRLVVVEYHPLLEHPVPVPRDVHALDHEVALLMDGVGIDGEDLFFLDRHEAQTSRWWTPRMRRDSSGTSGTTLLNSWVMRRRSVV